VDLRRHREPAARVRAASLSQRDAHEVQVSYDPELGYPTDFSIDYEEQVADEELGMRVTEEPLPIPLGVASPPTS
jgi:hypothetical protein